MSKKNLDELKKALEGLSLKDVQKVTRDVMAQIRAKEEEERRANAKNREANLKKIWKELEKQIKKIKTRKSVEFDFLIPVKGTAFIACLENYRYGNARRVEPRVSEVRLDRSVDEKDKQNDWLDKMLKQISYSIEDWFYDGGTSIPEVNTRTQEMNSEMKATLLEAKRLAKLHGIEPSDIEVQFYDKIRNG